MNLKCFIIDLIHNTRHLYTRLRVDWIKAMSHGCSGKKQVIKSCRYKKSRSDLFILGNRNEKLFIFKTIMANYLLASH